MKKGTKWRRKARRLLFGGTIGILALGALIVFGLFRIKDIEVKGNKNFSSAQIKETVLKDGLCQNTLYLLWKYSDPAKAEASLPFLNGVEVRMLSPFKVRFQVHEKKAVGYTQALGKYVYFDRTGMVLEHSQKLHEDVPMVTGLTVDKVNLYERLSTTEEEKFSNVLLVADMLIKEDLKPDEIRYSTKNELILIFGKLNVMMGDESSIEEKVAVLAAILPTVEQKSGNLYMENYSSQSQTVTYRDVPEEEGEPETDENGNVIPPEESSGGAETPETPTYQESDGTFATDASGVEYYMDKNGNITYQIEQYNYVDENGGIITDGYGYIDPYTGGYIQ